MESVSLPEKLRPISLAKFVGQKHLVGKDGIVKKLLKKSQSSKDSDSLYFPSLIFWGPPGSGKTTLARIIANELKRNFYELSAVNTSSKEIEKIVDLELEKKDGGSLFENNSKPTKTPLAPIIFVDEIHRFNKAQQDRLLPRVEKGEIILFGATTENPSFEVIGPLISRCRVLTLEQLTNKDLGILVARGEKELEKKLDKKANKFLIEASNGDARVLLNVLDIAASLSNSSKIVIKDIEDAIQKRYYTFDKKGEEYYNVISAFIKSMRASNVDAALYYLARMVEAGQDPLYIARRMVVFASEDVESPTALVVANAVFRACETIGYPECQENLAAGVFYLAKAKKDRSAYNAYFKALDDVKKYGNLPVPMEIRNAPTKLMKELGYGKGYKKYTKESLLPEKLKKKKYYES